MEKPLPEISNRTCPILVAVCEAANERSVALEIFLDEVQYLSPEELASLIVACHEVAQRNLPLFFVGAGLRRLPPLSGNAKSYAERHFTYPQVGHRRPRGAVHPAKNEGVDFQDDAVEEILRVTERGASTSGTRHPRARSSSPMLRKPPPASSPIWTPTSSAVALTV